MRRTWTMIFTVIFLSISVAAESGEYQLVEGTLEACKAYEKNLNSFKDLPYAMVCERHLNPDMKDFSKPAWKRVDVWENREKILDVGEVGKWIKPNSPEARAHLLGRIREDLQAGMLALYETFIDFDNDGELDHVFRYDYNKCDPGNEMNFAMPTGRSIFVWDDRNNRIDKNLTSAILVSNSRFNIFFYKGKSYADTFGGGLGFKDGMLFVYEAVIHNQGLNSQYTVFGGKICSYLYISKEKGE